jgi:outer membrane protein TolC
VLLGLKLSPDELVLADKLPDPPALQLVEDQLVTVAERSRLDLVAAGYVIEATSARVEQEKLSVISDVELGVSFERERRGRRGDRPWLADTLWASAEAGALAAPSIRPREKLPTDTMLGPTLSLELPIFDQNQAQIARAEFLYRTAIANRDALLLEVTQETRAAIRRARTAWDVSGYYRDSLLPLVQTNLDLSREAYTAGKLSLLAVLEAQKAMLASRSRYVEALREGVVSLTELEKAVGLPVERMLREAATPTSGSSGTEVQR